jgi:hypothetical protein
MRRKTFPVRCFWALWNKSPLESALGKQLKNVLKPRFRTEFGII